MSSFAQQVDDAGRLQSAAAWRTGQHHVVRTAIRSGRRFVRVSARDLQRPPPACGFGELLRELHAALREQQAVEVRMARQVLVDIGDLALRAGESRSTGRTAKTFTSVRDASCQATRLNRSARSGRCRVGKVGRVGDAIAVQVRARLQVDVGGLERLDAVEQQRQIALLQRRVRAVERIEAELDDAHRLGAAADRAPRRRIRPATGLCAIRIRRTAVSGTSGVLAPSSSVSAIGMPSSPAMRTSSPL